MTLEQTGVRVNEDRHSGNGDTKAKAGRDGNEERVMISERSWKAGTAIGRG